MTRLLIVEDNDFFRRTLVDILRRRFPDFDILGYPTGTGALDEVRRFSPDIVVLDINLPGESGIDLSRKIRSADARVQVIICTILDSPEYRDVARNIGIRHFIDKGSVSSEEIFRAVAQAEAASKSERH
ncbi:MAG: response regulator transcription factor [Deltaproteobacteria bacterium]|nr:response regulator transcription factor [Deltaproteobacteria bacterium]